MTSIDINEKVFTPIRSDIIPIVSKQDGFNKSNNLSDDYYVVAETISGEQRIATALYDHNRNKWLINRSGCTKVLVFYLTEDDPNFLKWLSSQTVKNPTSIEFMREIFNSMDEEDKHIKKGGAE